MVHDMRIVFEAWVNFAVFELVPFRCAYVHVRFLTTNTCHDAFYELMSYLDFWSILHVLNDIAPHDPMNRGPT